MKTCLSILLVMLSLHGSSQSKKHIWKPEVDTNFFYVYCYSDTIILEYRTQKEYLWDGKDPKNGTGWEYFIDRYFYIHNKEYGDLRLSRKELGIENGITK